jgi:DTW domain-containing protein YfiP
VTSTRVPTSDPHGGAGLPPSTSSRGTPRCGRCALPPDLCLCAEVAPLALATRVVVLLHRREIHKPTNTARLVPIALANSEARVVGRPDDRALLAGLDAPPAMLLFPSERSRVLTPELARELHARGAPTLVVPDGNWRQARKLACEPALAPLAHVRLPDGPRSTWSLRNHPDPGRLATFEAICRALALLEGDEVAAALERVLALKVERVRWTRQPPPRDELAASPYRPSR